MKYPGYYTKPELDRRGWAKKMYDDYLPEPHKRVPNPVNPGFASMRLYDRKVVEEIEACPYFQAYYKWTNEKFRPLMKKVAAERKERRAQAQAEAERQAAPA
jgi:hypothetical protein